MQRRMYDAFLYRGGKLEPLKIIAKRDQRFADFATPWELEYSVLAGQGSYYPVLDESFTVIDHTGSTLGDSFTNLIGPAFIAEGLLRINSESVLRGHLANGIEIFVHSHEKPTPPGSVRLRVLTSEHEINVLTWLDGQIFDFSVSNAGYLQTVDYSLMDILTVGTILVGLATKLGGKVVKALIRRATAKREARMFLEGAIAAYKRAPQFIKVSRRINVGSLHPRVQGRADATIKEHIEREIHAANRFAQRADVDAIHLGEEARRHFNAPTGKFPDVVAKKGKNAFLLSEGKGTDMRKVIEQFNAATPKIAAAEAKLAGSKATVAIEISEQEVVVEKLTEMHVDGRVLFSPGNGYAVNSDFYLMDATGPVMQLARANGKPIKVIVIEQTGGAFQSPFSRP